MIWKYGKFLKVWKQNYTVGISKVILLIDRKQHYFQGWSPLTFYKNIQNMLNNCYFKY